MAIVWFSCSAVYTGLDKINRGFNAKCCGFVITLYLL